MKILAKRPRFVLLDRDGTIIKDCHYLSDPGQVELLPHAASGLRGMMDRGWNLAVISNQSGVGRGFFSLDDLHRVNNRMLELLKKEQVEIKGVFFCPHVPDQNCACRKPRPGLVREAARVLNFEPDRAVVIGDKICDIDLGRNIGARTILVRTGHGREEEQKTDCRPDVVVDDLEGAARMLDAD
ncbi:MAG: HAD family hydrolase [Pseudomonadota bacterium]